MVRRTHLRDTNKDLPGPLYTYSPLRAEHHRYDALASSTSKTK